MAAPRTPSEIARETLKQLAARRLSPTPENYRALYDEIADTPSAPPFPAAPLRAITRVLPAQTPAQRRLLDQLENAIAEQSWALLQSTLVGYANLGLQGAAVATPAVREEVADGRTLPPRLTEMLARLVENALTAAGEDDARLLGMGQELVDRLRGPDPETAATERLLADLSHRLSFAAQDQAAVRASLLALLRLVFENIALLSTDDAWVQGQVEALLSASTPPLNLRRLDELEHRLKDVVFKQGEAKARLDQAQAQMRALLTTFIERLAELDASSSNYQGQLEQCAERISRATQLYDITPVLEEAVNAARAMALASRVTHGELQDQREHAEARHAEIDQLRQELDRASAQARHDPLTGSLNRKGLDEALAREMARSSRQETPLCVALLDLDNFKALNDRLGHATGDEALVHLAEVARQVLRPQDQLARYGGEEFVILLPDTEVEDGVRVMQRLQRELTKRYFLKDDERVLITFSAGVAQVREESDGPDALRRADQAMYLAKRSGKNRVVPA
ncbi:GGDEF domain-containing protein [Melaminivora alkalimesophila]|uniref:diguanylate cyclase n=1 Tax=Melaminivora alkalimesophila TaxID=1165852 RepID=A0A317RCH2_9BURK|nr:GGDEF domain-containing protein [Melaminivora alkalimesophila]PWW45825.1 diguanylate cyclase [Melaminivora alkalimesophila]